ncbi:hypothetical protein AQUCO_01000035v1 [Aquilegia coerulea]|uniref:Uncharacterized protein n=1 Tax=Aquilegia coerulea TaxID=218851 RepID=A0A2G5E830_AQUCA|nr:hypothetical protein AQUCO_01000035v1 [Aquilegia coerulea]
MEKVCHACACRHAVMYVTMKNHNHNRSKHSINSLKHSIRGGWLTQCLDKKPDLSSPSESNLNPLVGPHGPSRRRQQANMLILSYSNAWPYNIYNYIVYQETSYTSGI